MQRHLPWITLVAMTALLFATILILKYSQQYDLLWILFIVYFPSSIVGMTIPFWGFILCFLQWPVVIYLISRRMDRKAGR